MADTPLVSLQPPATLVLKLERGIQAKTVLKVTNVSSSKVAFKVKTTQPTWYFVRPNQQILDAGKTEEVSIILVDAECNRYLDQLALNQEEKTDKHRFLVQSKVIDEDLYARLLSLDATARSDELNKVWDGPRDDRRSVKLKVEFRYSEHLSAPSPRSPVNSTGSDTLRSTLSREDNLANTPEVMLAELQNMRKKYDAVVEYTVHLTAERDAIVAQLENLQRELNKEKGKKKLEGSLGREKSEKKVVEKGFSLFVVLLVAFVAFLVAKYFT
eukprot:gene27455-33158_t